MKRNLPIVLALRRSLFGLVFVVAMVSCKSSESSLMKTFDAPTQTMIKNWKDDAWGCKKVRRAPEAEKLQAAFGKGVARTDIEALLGKAEKVEAIKGGTLISYFFDGECAGGKLKDGTVYCILSFTIDPATKKSKSGSVICG